MYEISWHSFLIGVSWCVELYVQIVPYLTWQITVIINTVAYTATLRLTSRFSFIVNVTVGIDFFFVDRRWCYHAFYISSSTDSSMAVCVLQCCVVICTKVVVLLKRLNSWIFGLTCILPNTHHQIPLHAVKQSSQLLLCGFTQPFH